MGRGPLQRCGSNGAVPIIISQIIVSMHYQGWNCYAGTLCEMDVSAYRHMHIGSASGASATILHNDGTSDNISLAAGDYDLSDVATIKFHGNVRQPDETQGDVGSMSAGIYNITLR